MRLSTTAPRIFLVTASNFWYPLGRFHKSGSGIELIWPARQQRIIGQACGLQGKLNLNFEIMRVNLSG